MAQKRSLLFLLLLATTVYPISSQPTTLAVTAEVTSADTATTADSSEGSSSVELAVPSNNVEASTAPSEGQDEKVTLDVVRLPQNRIPLRLLQRNRWLPKTTTVESVESSDSIVTESTTTPQPNFQRGKPVENMIIDKSRPNGAGTSFVQEIAGRAQQQPGGDEAYEIEGPIREKENRFVASSSKRLETDNTQQLQRESEPVFERSQTSLDFPRMQPINRHFQTQLKPGPPQQLNTASVDSGPRQNGLNNLLKPVYGGSLGRARTDGRSGRPTNTGSRTNGDSISSSSEADLDNSTPLPLPVPLDSVPFHIRPRQEIQNRLLEAEWLRAGLNLSLYLPTTAGSKSSQNPTQTTTPIPTTASTPPATTETTTTANAPTVAAPVRSIFAEFMVNKNENVREYLKAVFDNRLDGERSVSTSDWRPASSPPAQQYQYFQVRDDKLVRA